MTIKSILSLALLGNAAAAVGSVAASAIALEPRQAQPSGTSSAEPPSETPGFVNNGTIGTYPCAISNTSVNPLAYSPDQVPGCANALPPVYPHNEIRLRAPDNSIRATFLPYGATLTEMWVKDRYGNFRDIVLGFDNKTNYATDTIHPNFGPVVGRYANRIKNGTFEVDGQTYKTPLNENNISTLHGGNVGYDRSSWKVADLNSSWVQFTLYDPDGNQGFPGAVNTTVEYWLESNGTWRTSMRSTATKNTPIMLSSHVYWNLEAYNETQSILNYTMQMPQATQYVETDGILIPTGQLPAVNGTGFDFREPTVMNDLFNKTQGACGTGCQGWDNCWVFANHSASEPVLHWWSPRSGIKMTVISDQTALQLYSCPGITSPVKKIPRKRAHGGDGTLDKIYENHSCGVIEAEDYIDAINHPEWNRNVVYGPQRPYTWNAVYTFSAVNADGSPAAPVEPVAANASIAAASASGKTSSNAAATAFGTSSTSIFSSLLVIAAATYLL